jgi:signal transduction histidine kinase/HAMP domain-containing protein
MQRSRSIVDKYIFLGFVILGLIGIFTGLSFWFTERIKGDARRINLAGRERMLSFEIASLLNRSINEPEEIRIRRIDHIRTHMALLEGVLYALRDGDERYGLGPLPYKNKDVTEHIDKLIKRWHSEIKPILMNAEKDLPEVVRRYNAIIHDYVKDIDDFVDHLEKGYKNELTLYGNLRLAVLFMATLVFLLIMFYIRNKLVRPMRILRDGVISIGKGNFDISIDVNTNDEIGILATEINKMSSELKKTYSEITRKNERLLKLYDIALSLDKEIKDICNKVTSSIAEVLNVRLVCVSEIRGDEVAIVSMYKDGELIDKETFPFPDANLRDIFPDLHLVHESQLMLDKSGKVISMLSLMDDHQKDLSHGDIEFIYTTGKKLILAMQRKREEEEKKVLETQLFQSQKMEAIGTLAAGIAHDFNNLLTGIMGYLELAYMSTTETNVKKQISRVLSISERAADLARQILLIGRKLPPDIKPTDINQVVENSMKMLRRMVEENIEIKVQPQAELPLIGADPSQIMQVLMNLVVNARDAMPNGGRIEIRTEKIYVDEEYCKHYAYAKPGVYVVVSVSDSGTGIPEEIRDRIFEPFFTTKEVGKGTGLGLSVVYSIVKNHGGWINLYSETGKGSEFKIYLPAESIEDNETGLREDLKERQDLPRGTETILLVDDEQIIRELGESILRSLGYSVITASNGEEAVMIYKEQHKKIAVVIMDRIMPGMNGIEAYGKLREINPHVKVIISSGYAADEAQILRESGITGFLNKPYRMANMAEAVRKAIECS